MNITQRRLNALIQGTVPHTSNQSYFAITCPITILIDCRKKDYINKIVKKNTQLKALGNYYHVFQT